MRHRLLVTLGLAVLAAVSVAGVSASGASVLGNDGSAVTIQLPGGQSVTQLLTGQCLDGKDNDSDGLIDQNDPNCLQPPFNSESGTSGGGGTTTPGGTTTNPGTTTTTPPGGTYKPPSGGGHGGGHGGGNGNGNGHGHGNNGGGGVRAGGNHMPHKPTRKPDGKPTNANPSLSVGGLGPAPIGVPNFMIDQFTIPPFLLPIYQACGTQYGIPWEVLAGINKIETAFGTNLNVSSAGAVGWMQFIPSTWRTYGVDANNDGRKDPYNPVDAICAAARYLKAAGGDKDLRTAILAYNHANWYVDEVLLYARQYGKLPDDLVGSLTGLTEGDRFPVAAKSRYADDISESALAKKAKKRGGTGNVADVVSSSSNRTGINIYSRRNAPVVAVNDGTIKDMGHSKALGNFIVLEDSYGNRFTYAQLGKLAKVYPVPKQHKLKASDFKLVTPNDKSPNAPASRTSTNSKGVKQAQESESAGGKGAKAAAKHVAAKHRSAAKGSSGGGSSSSNAGASSRLRLYAFPSRAPKGARSDLSGQLDQVLGQRMPGYNTVRNYLGDTLDLNKKNAEAKPLRKGARVSAGTVLGRIGKTDKLAPHLHFEIQPAGKKSPKIDPKPILDGWQLLESTAIYRANGKNPFAGIDVGQVLLMSQTQLEKRVLSDPDLSIYSCGRNDIRTGQIDRRVLATMEYLVAKGYRLTITSLKCGHSYLTTSGNVSEHTTGDAMDIAQVNGIPILGHQGKGTITEAVIRDLLQLQGPMQPHQIISLMDLGGPSFALPDHYDHIHVGFYPQAGSNAKRKQFSQVLKPDQWKRLIKRISQIRNPKVPTGTSKYALPAGKSGKHGGKYGD